MNYEQKYKEALERARDMMSYKEVRREDMEYLFPELKESEGGEIRNWLIGYFQEYKSTGIIEEFANGLKIDSIIAWLEKQDNNADKFEPKFKNGLIKKRDITEEMPYGALDYYREDAIEDTKARSVEVLRNVMKKYETSKQNINVIVNAFEEEIKKESDK